MSFETTLLAPAATTNASEYPAERTTRYKAKTAHVAPSVNRLTFEEAGTCFLGVSLENSSFSRDKFEAMLDWASCRFPSCTILIGDSIHRITLASSRGCDPDAALPDALNMGRRFIQENDDLVMAYRDRTLFTYETCGGIQATPDYRCFHDGIRRCFQEIPAFRESVRATGRYFHRHSWDDFGDAERELRLQSSCDYLLEEFAVFACLQARGIPVMVYPGSLSTLAEISEGHHPGICPELRGLTVVELRIKRR